MVKVIIYSAVHCPYCVRAKELLRRKGVSFTELLVDDDAELREEMIAKSARRTVPQIFIDDLAIGGFDELYTLERQGKLDQLLRGKDNHE